MAKVIKAISAGDNSINVNGYAVNVKISSITGNFAIFGASGIKFASDADVAAMLEE